jgi:hypothetical protein
VILFFLALGGYSRSGVFFFARVSLLVVLLGVNWDGRIIEGVLIKGAKVCLPFESDFVDNL